MGDGDVLSHSTRKRLYDYISGHPGISYQMIKEVFHLNDGTLRYHLDRLLRADMILQRKKKNNRCYIPIDGVKKPALTGIEKKSYRLLEIIKSNPGLNRADLLRLSGLSRKDLTSTLNKLCSSGMVWKNGKGKRKVYEYISEKDLYREMIRLLAERFLNDEIDCDRFRDLKEDIDEMFGE